MRFRFLPFILLLVIYLLALESCATEDAILPRAEVDSSTSVFNLKESTMVLSEETNQDLRMFDVESGLLIYSVGNPQLDSISVGTIIISRPTAEAPGGFLRKVMEVEMDGNRMVLETEPANLPDAFSSYVWRLNGANEGAGRSDPEDAFFSYGEEPVVYDSLFAIPGVEDWKFRLYFELRYKIQFATQMQYSLSLIPGQSGMESARLGLERFSIDTVIFQMSFVREQGNDLIVDSTSQFTLADMGPTFSTLRTISLPRFPIDPPSSLVWVEPSIRFDIAEQVKYSIEMGNRFIFSFPGEFKGLYTKSGLNAPFVSDFDAPTGMTVDGRVFFEGSYNYTSGLSVGIGISPYSRGLFTIGARATAGPYLDITGDASGGVAAGTGLPPGGVGIATLNGHLSLGLATSAGLFMDANFFGLAPDDWDIEQTLWEERYPVIDLGIDNSCGYFFSDLTTSLVYQTFPYSVDLTVVSVNLDGINVEGVYDVYLDNVLLAQDLTPNSAPQRIQLPVDITYDRHSLRLVRKNNPSVLFCERTVDFIYADPPTSESCVGVDFLIDPSTEATYCIRELGADNDRWFASNLYALIPGSGGTPIRPQCPDGQPFNCAPYGGLYDFNDLLDVPPGLSPSTTQGLCPDGYHVPSVAEWLRLFGLPADEAPLFDQTYFLQGLATPFLDELAFNEGSEPGSPNLFDALPAGYYTFSSNPGFSAFSEEAVFWTSTDFPSATGDQTAAYAVRFTKNSSDVEIVGMPRTQGNSCRCVQD